MSNEKQQTAVAIKKEETIDVLSKRIKALQNAGEIHFPPDYSPQNALKSAWLAIQGAKDKDNKPALSVCTPTSIYNSMFDMVITGLNPAKKQGYFLVYGNQLVFQRSYFGSEALARRVDSQIAEIVAEPVYEGDEFEYEIIKGKKVVTKHKQTIESMNSKKVKAAYCIVIGHGGEIRKTDIMTFEEIKKAWGKSKVHPVEKDGTIKIGSTHDEFQAEMVRKTVINRTCKPIFNSSDDKYLKIAAQRSEVIQAEDEAQEEIAEKANQDFIDVETVSDQPAQVAAAEEQKEPAAEKEKIWITCPAKIDKHQPKKAVEVCEKCSNRMQCDPYVDWASGEKKQAGIAF